MASGFHLFLVLGLASGLWMETNADHPDYGHCCETCPSGWTQLSSRCYIFNFQKKDWAGAELSCISLGGNLASVRDPSDYKLFRDMVKQATGSDKATWLGGHVAAKKGVWLWSDGSKFNFKGWHRGEPNNRGLDNCMEMNFRGRDYVNDLKCHRKRFFICARDPSC